MCYGFGMKLIRKNKKTNQKPASKERFSGKATQPSFVKKKALQTAYKNETQQKNVKSVEVHEFTLLERVFTVSEQGAVQTAQNKTVTTTTKTTDKNGVSVDRKVRKEGWNNPSASQSNNQFKDQNSAEKKARKVRDKRAKKEQQTAKEGQAKPSVQAKDKQEKTAARLIKAPLKIIAQKAIKPKPLAVKLAVPQVAAEKAKAPVQLKAVKQENIGSKPKVAKAAVSTSVKKRPFMPENLLLDTLVSENNVGGRQASLDELGSLLSDLNNAGEDKRVAANSKPQNQNTRSLQNIRN